MTAVDRIESAINEIDSIEDIRRVAALLNTARTRLSGDLRAGFRVGDAVWFVARRGIRVDGVVDRVNRKTIGVRPDDGGRGWRVSPTLLNRTEGGEA